MTTNKSQNPRKRPSERLLRMAQENVGVKRVLDGYEAGFYDSYEEMLEYLSWALNRQLQLFKAQKRSRQGALDHDPPSIAFPGPPPSCDR